MDRQAIAREMYEQAMLDRDVKMRAELDCGDIPFYRSKFDDENLREMVPANEVNLVKGYMNLEGMQRFFHENVPVIVAAIISWTRKYQPKAVEEVERKIIRMGRDLNKHMKGQR